MLVTGALIALAIFFVFGLDQTQPSHQELSATKCLNRPETGVMPIEYSCERQ